MFGLNFGSKQETMSKDELLKEAFGDLMGPVGMPIFEAMKNKGFNKKEILDYVNKLESDSIVKKDNADRFRGKINSILE